MIYSPTVEFVKDIVRNLGFPRKLQNPFAKLPASLLINEELDRLSNHRGDGLLSVLGQALHFFSYLFRNMYRNAHNAPFGKSII
jgi:hypothetical protein